MKGLVIARLATHILVLIGLLGFFAMFPAMLPGFLMSLVRVDLLVKACGARPANCLALGGFWVVIVVAIVALVWDIRMLRRKEGVEGRLWRSLALEALLPAGWYAVLRPMGKSDLVGPVWLMFPGPAIMLSAIASAVVAWLLVSDRLKSALGAARLWLERALALALTLIAGALAYLFADLLISQFAR